MKRLAWGYLACAFAAALQSCATPPPPKKISVSERIELDREIGRQLSEQLEPQLDFTHDSPVQSYLSKIGQSIADKNQTLHIPDVRVLLLRRKDHPKRPENYSLPGGKIYLAIESIHDLVYENELAAVLSIELGRLMTEQIFEYLKKSGPSTTEQSAEVQLRTLHAPEKAVFFGPGGMLQHTLAQDESAVTAGIQIMYAGGYDPRGMITLLERFEKNKDGSPFDPKNLPDLLEHAHKQLVYQPPLRNPIVQSDAFIALREKIRKL